MIYSGKGGVGKTTTAFNISRQLAKHGKVVILDADVNTPSMQVLSPEPTSWENIEVLSMGYNQGIIHLQGALIGQYFGHSLRRIKTVAPDYLIIDTPPSITDAHINLMAKLSLSGILFVTQPTALSKADVMRTITFFTGYDIPALGVVENMVTPDSPVQEYGFPIVGRVMFSPDFSGTTVYDQNLPIYETLAGLCMGAKEAEANKDFTSLNVLALLEDNIILPDDFDWHHRYRKSEYLKFRNVPTWGTIRQAILNMEADAMAYGTDRTLWEATPERIERTIKSFVGSETAYFMISRPVTTEIKLLAGEIGEGTLHFFTNQYNLPGIKYKTAKGEVCLFPHEYMPVDFGDINSFIADGYFLTQDRRYIPPREVVEEVYDSFFHNDEWEALYEETTKLLKK